MTDTANDKQAKKEALKARSDAMNAKEQKLNEGKTGKGTRTFVSMTRGKASTEVQYEGFDTDQPKTLPESMDEFLTLAGAALGNDIKEPLLVSYMIDGFNSAQYDAASDETAEYVETTWSDTVQKSFRDVVRNFAKNNGLSIEDAVNLIKPAYLASQKGK